MNIANKVTISRIIITVIFVILASMDSAACRWAAWSAGLTAAISDILDGDLARKYDLVTDFGKFMDPLADKIFVAAAFIVLVENNIVPGWLVITILSREFAVTGLRLIAATKGKVIDAAMSGKMKTLTQFIYIGCCGVVWGLHNDAGLQVLEQNIFYYIIQVLMIATAIITVYSGYEYFAKNKELYMEDM
ncbi:MAG: CDP-diacylglycerol--glycerol-3-phosphate 3-phosphatidyltransferase [Lentisphaeraceae bacterium]|nr:CDP-diacylglycerol--glycerol-3-phosphate 3-phosphatidyltransferase [Lentisphaeraceae bacterium]